MTTIHDAMNNPAFVTAIAAAQCKPFDGEPMPKTVECSVTGITVCPTTVAGKFSLKLLDGTEVTDLYDEALNKAMVA